MNLYDRGLAPTTHKNRAAQAKRYVAFMVRHHVDPVAPRAYDALQYVTYLFAALKAPASVKNAISGARSWISEQDGCASAFNSPSVKRLCRGGERAASHKVRPSPPLTPQALRAVVMFLRSLGPSTVMPIAALLVGYFSFLRQSNLVSPSPLGWGGPHTLRRQDITASQSGLWLSIHSSKTISSPDKAVELLVPAIPHSPLCPVAAWSLAASSVPASGSAPAFLASLSHPLDSSMLTNILRLSLKVVDIPFHSEYTIRSLRRGAAQACLSLGVPLEAIKAQGTWESAAVYAYIPRRAPSAAPLALASFFGRATGAAEGFTEV